MFSLLILKEFSVPRHQHIFCYFINKIALPLGKVPSHFLIRFPPTHNNTHVSCSWRSHCHLYTLPYLGLPQQCSLAFSRYFGYISLLPFIYRNTLSYFPSIFIFFLMSSCTFSEHSHPSSWDSVSFLLLVTIIITFNYLKCTARTCFPNFSSSPPPKSIAIWLPFPQL